MHFVAEVKNTNTEISKPSHMKKTMQLLSCLLVHLLMASATWPKILNELINRMCVSTQYVGKVINLLQIWSKYITEFFQVQEFAVQLLI